MGDEAAEIPNFAADAAGLPEEARAFFSQAHESIASVLREGERQSKLAGDAVQEILEGGALPDQQRLYHLLESTCCYARVTDFERLIERFLGQIEPNRRLEYYGRTPFQLAASLGSVAAMQQLRSRGAVIDSVAVHRGLWSDDGLTWLLQHGANPDSTADEKWGLTCLMEACLSGRISTVKLLLQFGATVDAQEVEGRTALWFSSRNRRLQCVEILLAAGADPNLPDHYGRTPLMRAKGLSIPRVLLAAGADPYLRDSQGETAYDIADGRREFRKLLLEAMNKS